jgi:hypothetical protein
MRQPKLWKSVQVFAPPSISGIIPNKASYIRDSLKYTEHPDRLQHDKKLIHSPTTSPLASESRLARLTFEKKISAKKKDLLHHKN